MAICTCKMITQVRSNRIYFICSLTERTFSTECAAEAERCGRKARSALVRQYRGSRKLDKVSTSRYTVTMRFLGKKSLSWQHWCILSSPGLSRQTAIKNGVTAILHRPEAITKLVPGVYHTNVHILWQQIKVINYEGYIQNKLVVLLFSKPSKKCNACRNQI